MPVGGISVTGDITVYGLPYTATLLSTSLQYSGVSFMGHYSADGSARPTYIEFPWYNAEVLTFNVNYLNAKDFGGSFIRTTQTFGSSSDCKAFDLRNTQYSNINQLPPGGFTARLYLYELFAHRTTVANYLTVSDETLKTDIQPIQGALRGIESLRTVWFRWKKGASPQCSIVDGEDCECYNTGFLAQNIQTIYPHTVSTNESTGTLQVDYVSMIPIIASAVKELSARRVRTGWVRLSGGVATVDVAATYGQAFADTVQQLATRSEEPGKEHLMPVVITQNVDGWDPLRASVEHASSALSIVIQSRNTESTNRVSYTLTVDMAAVDDTQSLTPEVTGHDTHAHDEMLADDAITATEENADGNP